MTDSNIHRATRDILAPPRAIYRALVDAEAMSGWRAPAGATGRVERFDPRIGGGYRMSFVCSVDVQAQGETSAREHLVEGRFIDLLPDSRVVEEICFESDDPRCAGTMKLTTTIEKSNGGGSKVTLLAENVPPGIDKSDHVNAMAATLRRLANLLE